MEFSSCHTALSPFPAAEKRSVAMKRTREESSPAKASKKEKELATETPGEVISAIGSTVDSKTRCRKTEGLSDLKITK